MSDDKEDKAMSSALSKKIPNFSIDYKKLLENFELPKIKDGVIILNPNNPDHVRWLEDKDENNE
jgi:bifunctional pyridoxal-dependent enzyme with beta-cystathionase and maltose regulon repressor activities